MPSQSDTSLSFTSTGKTSQSQNSKSDVDAAAAVSLLAFRGNYEHSVKGTTLGTHPTTQKQQEAEPRRAPTRARGVSKGSKAWPSTPGSSESKWTTNDDSALRQGVIALGKNKWKEIVSQYLDNRFTDTECIQRYDFISRPGGVKGSWTVQEDQIIIREVQKCNKMHGYNPPAWATIAKLLPGRIGKQCRERWVNHLDPDLTHSAFSKKEDAQLFKLHSKFGNKWAVIARYMPGRSDNAVKNRWYSQFSWEGKHKKQENIQDQSATSHIDSYSKDTLDKSTTRKRVRTSDDSPPTSRKTKKTETSSKSTNRSRRTSKARANTATTCERKGTKKRTKSVARSSPKSLQSNIDDRMSQENPLLEVDSDGKNTKYHIDEPQNTSPQSQSNSCSNIMSSKAAAEVVAALASISTDPGSPDRQNKETVVPDRSACCTTPRIRKSVRRPLSTSRKDHGMSRIIQEVEITDTSEKLEDRPVINIKSSSSQSGCVEKSIPSEVMSYMTPLMLALKDPASPYSSETSLESCFGRRKCPDCCAVHKVAYES